jgi:hypothetical protein
VVCFQPVAAPAVFELSLRYPGVKAVPDMRTDTFYVYVDTVRRLRSGSVIKNNAIASLPPDLSTRWVSDANTAKSSKC